MSRKVIGFQSAVKLLAGQIALHKRFHLKALTSQVESFVWARSGCVIDDLPCGHTPLLSKALEVSYDEEAERMYAKVICPKCEAQAAEVTLWPPLPSRSEP